MSFSSLQRLPAAMRDPEQPRSGRSRFGVVLTLATRASARRKLASPLRSYAWRMRCGGARGRTCCLRLSRGTSSRRCDVSPIATQDKLVSGHPRGRLSAKPICTRSRTTRHIKRYRFTGILDLPIGARRSRKSAAQAGSCTDAFLGAVYRYRTARAFAAWLVRLFFPRKLAPAALMGFYSLFAGLLPHSGDQPSLADRTHLPFPFSVRPIDFRRADFTAHSCRKNESKQSSGKSWIDLNVRLLGFAPVCGPRASFNCSLAGVPALSFFLFQDSGHARKTCSRTGSTPFGSSASKSLHRILRGGAFYPLMGFVAVACCARAIPFSVLWG